MKFLKDNLVTPFTNAARDIASGVKSARQSLKNLKQKMDEDPQVRIAVFHGATYAACLIIPAVTFMALSKINDGTFNIWRVPDGSEKIEISRPD